MSKKFTEEQYREIIRTYENNYGYEYKVMAVIRVVDDFNLDNNLSYNEAVAIANPLTREWARKQFVEKEKKYVWTSKNTDNKGRRIRLYKKYGNSIATTFNSFNDKLDRLTESEIKAWGYNPEMFDKEEV